MRAAARACGASWRGSRAVARGVMVASLAAVAFGCSSAHLAGVHNSGGEQQRDQAPQPWQVAVHQEDELAVRIRRQIGRSVDGRKLWVYHWGDPDSSRSLLVVGCIHGNETAGIAVARLVIRGRPAGESNVWVIPDLNPDGVIAGTRQNADGVDLNRNFRYRWRPLGRRGTPYYAGSAPLSEPESRAVARFILRVRPSVSIWFHQPYGVVDQSGGSLSLERRFARLVGLPLERLPRYPGSASTWQNHQLPGSTAFVVELPSLALTRSAVRRYAEAVTDLA